MKTKAQKRNEAKKQAETIKAQRKAVRNAKLGLTTSTTVKKGKSIIPQSKKKK